MVTGIMMDQVRSLRSRAILERIRTHQDKGAFLQIGNTCAEVCQEARRLDLLAQTCGDCLSEADARRAAEFPTGIKRLKEGEFELLFRHGFEVANYTLCAYYPLEFQDITYRAPWAATAVAGATAAE
jgi:NTE family protein